MSIMSLCVALGVVMTVLFIWGWCTDNDVLLKAAGVAAGAMMLLAPFMVQPTTAGTPARNSTGTSTSTNTSENLTDDQ